MDSMFLLLRCKPQSKWEGSRMHRASKEQSQAKDQDTLPTFHVCRSQMGESEEVRSVWLKPTGHHTCQSQMCETEDVTSVWLKPTDHPKLYVRQPAIHEGVVEAY